MDFLAIGPKESARARLCTVNREFYKKKAVFLSHRVRLFRFKVVERKIFGGLVSARFRRNWLKWAIFPSGS